MTVTPGTRSCAPPSDVDLDAYCTTGSSPTERAPTLHVLGLGAVGLALLRSLRQSPFQVLGVTDSSGTARLDGRSHTLLQVSEIKKRGGSVASHLSGRPLSLDAAIHEVDADVVVDVTATDFTRPEWAVSLQTGVLEKGRTLVLAAKDSLCLKAASWLRDRYGSRLGINAVLGGVGSRFVRELPRLRTECRSLALAGSASTTAIIEVVERGGSVAQGIDVARDRGFLEADPELDLKGFDGAVKLAIVAGAVSGHAVGPSAIVCEDVRDVDPAAVRERASRGQTTRLVGRLHESGGLSLAYEALPVEHALSVPCERVAYSYALSTGETLTHSGDGLGPAKTAAAVRADLEELAVCRQPAPAGER